MDLTKDAAAAVPVAKPDVEERFATLAALHRDRALRLAWRLVGGDQAAAEDVIQDAFIRAYRGLPRFRDEASLDTWFYRIVVRQAYSYLRWRAVRARWSGPSPEDDASPASPELTGDPGLRRRIADALAALPRAQREVFLLVHLEGFTVLEAADILGRAPGTVKSHLHRALKALRRRLEGAFDEVSPTPSPSPSNVNARLNVKGRS